MIDKDKPDQEPEAAEVASPPIVLKGHRSLSKLRRELSDEELASPGVQKLLIDDIERLEAENGRLAEFQDKYYEANKRAAIFEEKDKKSLAQETIYGVCLTVGAAALGYAPAVWSSQPAGALFLLFGVILIVGGIASKVVKR